MKLRPARSARRALRSYLTAVTFRQHFPATRKIIRLLNKRGFSFRWLRLVSRGCDGARGNPGAAKSCVEGEKGRSRLRYENKGEKYSPIIISAKQTPQTSQTNCTTTQKAKIYIGVDCWAVTPPYYQQRISSRDPGRSGGEGGEGEA